MEIKLYLFGGEARSFEQLLRADVFSGAHPYQLIAEPARNIRFPHQGYIRINEPSTPLWPADLSNIYDVDEWGAENRSSSFVFLFQVKDRFFAACYGRGYQALNRDLLESDFGRRAALAGVDINRVRRVATRTIARNSRRRSTEYTVSSPLRTFAVEAGAEELIEVHGDTETSALVRRMGGKTALTITGELDFTGLEDICVEILECLKKPLGDKLQCASVLSAISRGDRIKSSLNQSLLRAIELRSRNVLAMSMPETDAPISAASFQLRFGRRAECIPELDVAALYSFLDRHGIDGTGMSRVKVQGFDMDGNPCDQQVGLLECVVAELEHSGADFAYVNGQWYRLSEDHVATSREIICRIPDLTKKWSLPPILPKEREDRYNQRLASLKGWLLLDKQPVSLGGQQKAEICDLVTSAGELICVKRMTGSDALSHLFAQGSVASDLLKNQKSFRQTLVKAIKSKWPNAELPATPVVVYAIPSSKTGPLWETIFGFSAVNLVAHINRIRGLGFDVALCSIAETELRLEEKPTGKRPSRIKPTEVIERPRKSA